VIYFVPAVVTINPFLPPPVVPVHQSRQDRARHHANRLSYNPIITGLGQKGATADRTRHENPSQATSILLVEQRARQSLEISHRGYILDSGKVVPHWLAKDLLANPMMARLTVVLRVNTSAQHGNAVRQPRRARPACLRV
jgi:hypothetical protein